MKFTLQGDDHTMPCSKHHAWSVAVAPCDELCLHLMMRVSHVKTVVLSFKLQKLSDKFDGRSLHQFLVPLLWNEHFICQLNPNCPVKQPVEVSIVEWRAD